MVNALPQTVLITGASSGIGKVTAIYLAQHGYHVVATSREVSRLDSLLVLAQRESLPISAYKLDVNSPASVGEVVPRILDELGRLDGLVNNAGYGLWGCLEDLGVEEVKTQFETNLFGVLRMTQAVLPHMRYRGSGTIINVGSVAGWIGTPAGGAYAASKFALEGLSRVWRTEVAQFGVRVVLIEPGLFRTNFRQNQAIGERALDPHSPYYSYAQRIRRNSSKNQRWAGDPVKVARLIHRILRGKRTRPSYAVGTDAKLGILARRLLPDSFLELLIKMASTR